MINNKISIYINDLLVHTIQDASPYLTEGTISLQASIGTLGPVTVYFDNIEVYELTPPTPTPTPPFPYYSQRDSNWKGNVYDSLKRTIEEVGCALTSAVMVLKAHGIDKIPWGEELRNLDPGTLNDWLNAQQMSDGYWKEGMISWSAITRLTKALNASDSHYTKLEYQIIEATDQGNIEHILSTKKHPLIFKHTEAQSPSNFHFVVATDKLTTDSGHLYTIKDPFFDSRTQLAIPPNKITRAGYFYPTESDFSYLYIHTDKQIIPLLISSGNEQTGIQEESRLQQIPQSMVSLENPLTNQLNHEDVTGSDYWQIEVKYPHTSNYQLILKSVDNYYGNITIYAYDRNAEVKIFKPATYISKYKPNKYQLLFDWNDSQKTQFKKITDLNTIRYLIAGMVEEGWLSSVYARVIYLKLDLTENKINKNLPSVVPLLRTIKSCMYDLLQEGYIQLQAYQLINDEIDLFIDQN